jgi:hypothetical protein
LTIYDELPNILIDLNNFLVKRGDEPTTINYTSYMNREAGHVRYDFTTNKILVTMGFGNFLGMNSDSDEEDPDHMSP